MAGTQTRLRQKGKIVQRIVILSDGETFSEIEGATVANLPDAATTEDVEAALKDRSLQVIDLCELLDQTK